MIGYDIIRYVYVTNIICILIGYTYAKISFLIEYDVFRYYIYI